MICSRSTMWVNLSFEKAGLLISLDFFLTSDILKKLVIPIPIGLLMRKSMITMSPLRGYGWFYGFFGYKHTTPPGFWL